MKYFRILLALLPFLLFSCSDTIERDEWQNGIYTLSAADTTLLFQVYHDPYLKNIDITSPLFIIVDDRDPSTENLKVHLSLTEAEGDNGELTSKQRYSAATNSFTYEGAPASINGATISNSGITVNMTIQGLSKNYSMHKQYEWEYVPFIDSGTYSLVIDTLQYELTFYPKDGRYLVLTKDSDPTTEDQTYTARIRNKEVININQYTYSYHLEGFYSPHLEYYDTWILNSGEGLEFHALYFDNQDMQESSYPLLKKE